MSRKQLPQVLCYYVAALCILLTKFLNLWHDYLSNEGQHMLI